MSNKKGELIKFSLSILEDGNLLTEIDYMKPDEYVKLSDELNPENPDAYVIASAIRFTTTKLQNLEVDLAAFLKGV